MLNQLLKYTPGRAAGPPRDKVLRTSLLNKVLCLDSTQSNTEENNKISVSIDVSNLKQTETFYIESLGCKKLIDQEDISVISAGNCDIYLRAKKAGTKPILSEAVKRGYGRHWTPVHLDFLTESVNDIDEKILQLGSQHEDRLSADLRR